MGYSIRTATHRYTRWINSETRSMVAEELYDYSASQSVNLFAGHFCERQNVAKSQPALLDRTREQMDTMLASRLKTDGH